MYYLILVQCPCVATALLTGTARWSPWPIWKVITGITKPHYDDVWARQHCFGTTTPPIFVVFPPVRWLDSPPLRQHLSSNCFCLVVLDLFLPRPTSPGTLRQQSSHASPQSWRCSALLTVHAASTSRRCSSDSWLTTPPKARVCGCMHCCQQSPSPPPCPSRSGASQIRSCSARCQILTHALSQSATILSLSLSLLFVWLPHFHLISRVLYFIVFCRMPVRCHSSGTRWSSRPLWKVSAWAITPQNSDVGDQGIIALAPRDRHM